MKLRIRQPYWQRFAGDCLSSKVLLHSKSIEVYACTRRTTFRVFLFFFDILSDTRCKKNISSLCWLFILFNFGRTQGKLAEATVLKINFNSDRIQKNKEQLLIVNVWAQKLLQISCLLCVRQTLLNQANLKCKTSGFNNWKIEGNFWNVFRPVNAYSTELCSSYRTTRKIKLVIFKVWNKISKIMENPVWEIVAIPAHE